MPPSIRLDTAPPSWMATISLPNDAAMERRSTAVSCGALSARRSVLSMVSSLMRRSVAGECDERMKAWTPEVEAPVSGGYDYQHGDHCALGKPGN